MVIGDLELRAESTSEIGREGSHLEIPILLDARPQRADEVFEVRYMARSSRSQTSGRRVVASMD